MAECEHLHSHVQRNCLSLSAFNCETGVSFEMVSWSFGSSFLTQNLRIIHSGTILNFNSFSIVCSWTNILSEVTWGGGEKENTPSPSLPARVSPRKEAEYRQKQEATGGMKKKEDLKLKDELDLV